MQAAFAEPLALTRRLLAQQRQDKHKLYALHAPEVESIAKGKVPKRYEFGVKVSIATTNRSNLVVRAQSMPGNPVIRSKKPYDRCSDSSGNGLSVVMWISVIAVTTLTTSPCTRPARSGA